MLHEQIHIGNVSPSNRIVAAPVVTNSVDDQGLPTARTLQIYREYAASGAGLVVTEQHAVHPWGRGALKQPRLYQDAFALALEPVTRIFREREIPIVAQLNFCARVTEAELLNEPDFAFVSPSGLETPRKSPVVAASRALTVAEISTIVESFADAARRASAVSKYNGGVQIYASHGYLIGQFLSPLTNIRTDSYGATLQNRARVLFEIVEAVKPVIGNAPLSVRLGVSDTMPGEPENGLTLPEGVWIAEELAKMGIDWLGISGNHCIYGIGVDDNDTAYFAPYSKAVRNRVHKYGVPVDCTGGIRSAKTAQKLLQSGVCDLIGIGRPLVSDKAFIKQWNV